MIARSRRFPDSVKFAKVMEILKNNEFSGSNVYRSKNLLVSVSCSALTFEKK